MNDDEAHDRFEERTTVTDFDMDDGTPVYIEVDGFGGLHIRLGETQVSLGPKHAREIRDTIHEQTPEGDELNPAPTRLEDEGDPA